MSKTRQRDMSFPESVVSMLRGDLGQPPGGWPEALQKKALKGEEPYTVRPGSLLEDADLDAERKAIEAKLEREIIEFEFASYLMYPKVFTDYRARQPRPTAPFRFCRRRPISTACRRAKNCSSIWNAARRWLSINQAMGATDDKGMVTVFFELNGQPRRIKVPDRVRGAAGGAVRPQGRYRAMLPILARRCRASSRPLPWPQARR